MSRRPYIILPIQSKWFWMIYRGIKKEEYREIKPYYTTRLCNIFGETKADLKKWLRCGSFQKITVLFRNGYSSSSPSFEADCTLRIKTGKEEWGAEPGVEYYTFEIGEIRWPDQEKI